MDDTRAVLLADAFGTGPFGGHRTAVVPDAAGLDRAAVAAELGRPVAFLDRSGDTDALRAVGTGVETAAIAAYGGLVATGDAEPGTCTVETEAGERRVEADEAGAWVESSVPAWEETEDEADALGVEAGELLDAPAGRAGGRTVVGAAYLSAFESATPDERAVGYTFETLDPDAHVAVWVEGGPAGPEDCSAVAAALDAADAFDGSFPEPLRCETGRLCDRPAELWVGDGRVGGPVAVSLRGELRVPEDDGDILVA
jgi:predicted PhzF superfamily epimerase YddE/YHI9